MTLLNHYLTRSGCTCRKGHNRKTSSRSCPNTCSPELDEEEAALGRPLTEVEQEALLSQHGNPAMVAERYGAPRRTVAFGWQLIGPELFPLYARVLL